MTSDRLHEIAAQYQRGERIRHDQVGWLISHLYQARTQIAGLSMENGQVRCDQVIAAELIPDAQLSHTHKRPCSYCGCTAAPADCTCDHNKSTEETRS